MAVPYKLSTLCLNLSSKSPNNEETFHVIIRKSDQEIVDYMSTNEPGSKEYMKNTLARMNTNSVLNNLGV